MYLYSQLPVNQTINKWFYHDGINALTSLWSITDIGDTVRATVELRGLSSSMFGFSLQSDIIKIFIVGKFQTLIQLRID